MPTQLRDVELSNLILRLKNKHGPTRPAHPTVQSIIFRNVSFDADVHMTEWPKLKSITFDSCDGTIVLKDLNLERIVATRKSD